MRKSSPSLYNKSYSLYKNKSDSKLCVNFYYQEWKNKRKHCYIPEDIIVNS